MSTDWLANCSCNFHHVQSSDCRILGQRQRSQRHPRTKSIRLSSTSVLPTASCFMTGGSSFSEDPTASTSGGHNNCPGGWWRWFFSSGAKGQMACKHDIWC